VYSTTNINPFFAIYNFYFNVSSLIRNDRLEGEIPIARKKIEEIKNENKELTER
jgi:hypothetical protein